MYFYMQSITTIQIRKSTRDKLIELGRKKETYDDLINRLVSYYVKNCEGRR